jgi:hypothetical protein
MKWTKLAAVATAAVAAVGIGLVGTGSAAASPTFISEPLGYVSDAGAVAYINLTSLAPLTGYGFNTAVDCTEGHQRTAVFKLGNKLASAAAITSRCAVHDDGTASSGSSVATLSVFGGLVTIKGIQSTCTYDGDNLTVGSTAASVSIAKSVHYTMLNGHTFMIPNVGELVLNYTFEDANGGETIPVLLETAPVYLGTHLLVPAQFLEIGGCGMNGGSYGD